MYCPASELRSAIRKLRNGNPLTFNEEYTIECLFHENVHSKAYGVLRHEAGSLNEIIQEVCTQLYAREKYTAILDAYGVESANHELIRYGGYGYRRQCDILRGIFTKDGVLQLGELKGIANQNVEGLELLKILCEKRGYDFDVICKMLLGK